MLSVLAVLVFWVYSNTLDGPFIFDDSPNIQDNPNIRLKTLTLEGIKRAGFESLSPYRPVLTSVLP
jgi:hypothetical protein